MADRSPSERPSRELPTAKDSVPLVDVLVDDITWRCATRARRTEWLQAITELCEDSRFVGPAPLRGYLTIEAYAIELAFHGPNGSRVGNMYLPRSLIAPIFQEYLRLIKAIGDQAPAAGASHIEAMDIARRLLHNDAADLLIQKMEGVLPDHRSARRLFTLLVLVTHDTTKLHAAWPS